MDILKVKNQNGEWEGIPALVGPKGDKGDKGDPGEDAVVDSTLKNSGQAADAAVTGNNFTDVRNVLNQLETNVDSKVDDVQIDGTSIIENGVASVPIIGESGSGKFGVARISRSLGVDQSLGYLTISPVNHDIIKGGGNQYYSIQPKIQHESTFYGLAKAAGSDEKDSPLPVGTYTEEAKAAIQRMIGLPDQWELINIVDTGDEDVDVIKCIEDQSGQPFSLKAAYIIVDSKPSEQVTGNVTLKIGVSTKIGSYGTSTTYELISISAGIRTSEQINHGYARITGIINDGRSSGNNIDATKITTLFDVGGETQSSVSRRIISTDQSYSDGLIHMVYTYGKYFGPGSVLRVWGIRV